MPKKFSFDLGKTVDFFKLIERGKISSCKISRHDLFLKTGGFVTPLLKHSIVLLNSIVSEHIFDYFRV